MSGFLNPYAVSIKGEYTRYLDADLLGKIVFKNFALNVLGIEEESIRIPRLRKIWQRATRVINSPSASETE